MKFVMGLYFLPNVGHVPADPRPLARRDGEDRCAPPPDPAINGG
jgi:hypothetical protein